ncbi:MAG: DUF2842 domain-containing protein [Paracoccaceae bacterium]|jgi:hypothetical protein|tara:strand:- start:318 stop:536 length:219 start_codon:yes stop_codon:yes gene_type:complete
MLKTRLSIKLKKRLSLLILLVGLPVYIILSITVLNLLDRPPIIVELGIYLILGILWALPFKYIFRGVGKDQE